MVWVPKFEKRVNLLPIILLILDSMATAQEVIFQFKKDDSEGFLLKLDFEKAFSRVNWDFILEVLSHKRFQILGSAGSKSSFPRREIHV